MDFNIRGLLKGRAGVLALLAFVLFSSQPGLAGGPEKTNPIQVEITTHLGDGQSFVAGDAIAFFLSLDTAAHIVAVYEDASHRRVQIIPNANQESNYYRSGIFHPIPGEEAPFRFLVTEPFGTERLCVFATETPMADLPGEVLDNGLKLLHGDMATLRDQIKAGAGTAFGESCLQIHTQSGK